MFLSSDIIALHHVQMAVFVFLQTAGIAKSPAAYRANVRRFAGMRPNVNGQVRFQSERLAAIGTRIRPKKTFR